MDSPTPSPMIPTQAILPLTREREMELRHRLVAEALTWERTPYYNLGDTKGVGVDCCMLLVRSLIDAGIVEPFDPRPYPTQWHLHNDEERYLAWMNLCGVEVEEPQIGDVVVWRFGRCFSHSAFLVSPGVVVHALADHRECSRTDMNEAFLHWLDKTGTRRRPVKYFDLFARLRETAGE